MTYHQTYLRRYGCPMNDAEFKEWAKSYLNQVETTKLKPFNPQELLDNQERIQDKRDNHLKHNIASGALGLAGTALAYTNPITGTALGLSSFLPQIKHRAENAGDMSLGYGPSISSPDQFENPNEREDYYRTDSQSTAPPAQIIAPKMP